MAILNTAKKWIGWDDEPDYDDSNVYQYNAHGENAVAAPAEQETFHSMVTIHPRNFNDARNIGEAFRSGMTTVVNLGTLSDTDGRRIVDFCTGLVLGLHGNIERVDTKVFILAPGGIGILSSADGSANSSPATSFYNVG